MTDSTRSGSCRCGAVSFRVRGAPMVTMACHCTGCQKMTGGPYSLSALFDKASFELQSGDVVMGGLKDTAQHYHCASCLSWLYSDLPGTELLNVRTTMLDGCAELSPFVETWTSERLPFASTGARHSFEGFPPPERYGDIMAEYATSAGRTSTVR